MVRYRCTKWKVCDKVCYHKKAHRQKHKCTVDYCMHLGGCCIAIKNKKSEVTKFKERVVAKLDKYYADYHCSDKEHDERWCPTCNGIRDGIDLSIQIVKKMR